MPCCRLRKPAGCGPITRVCSGGSAAGDCERDPTGSIFKASHADSWFGEKKSYQVGDVITVTLDESMDADATASNKASKKTKTDVLSPLQIAKWGSPGGLLSEDLQEENEISSEGSGVLDQSATFKGTMTAQVVEIYPNGNLMIRGKRLSTSQQARR